MKFPKSTQVQARENFSQAQENRHPNYPGPLPAKIAPTMLCQEEIYRKEIELFILSMRDSLKSKGNYFDFQLDISEHMRGVLLSWIVEVHLKYKLMDETFFLMVTILDAYLEKQKVSRGRLQLVGITALWIAAKYVETYQVPKLQNLVYICDNAYKSQDILAMEGSILSVVGFQILNAPSSLYYLELIQNHANLNQKDYCLARYLLEIVAFDLSIRSFSPALIAYAVVFFIKKLRGYRSWIEDQLRRECGVLEHEVKTVTRQLCMLWQKADQMSCLKTLKVKYSNAKYCQVSKIKLTQKST